MNKERQRAIDGLLDKLSSEGLDSLSPEELQMLNKLGSKEGEMETVVKESIFTNTEDPKRTYLISFEYEQTLNILKDNFVYPKHIGYLTIEGEKFPNGSTAYYGGFFIENNEIVNDFLDELSEELNVQMEMDTNLKRDMTTFLKLTNIQINLQ